MVTLNVKILQTHAQKSVGLIGAKHIYPVFFTTRWGIHTFGVLSPIDVLVLDHHNRVVKLMCALAPNRLWFWNPIHENVVELPKGTIAKKEIHAGDQITLHCV